MIDWAQKIIFSAMNANAISSCLPLLYAWQLIQSSLKYTKDLLGSTDGCSVPGTGFHSAMKRTRVSPATMYLRSDSPSIDADDPRTTEEHSTENKMSPETRSQAQRKLTLLTDASRVSPCSVVTFVPQFVETAYTGRTMLSKVSEFVEDAYCKCCQHGMFFRSKEPSEDNWGVVLATQSILYRLLPDLANIHKIDLHDDFSTIMQQSINVRQLMAAALLTAMAFQKSRGIAVSVCCPALGTNIPGCAAVYYSLFLGDDERRQVDETFRQSATNTKALIDQMSFVISFNQIELLKNLSKPYCYMARSVLNLAEELLWEQRAHLNHEQLNNARGVVVFLIRGAARGAPELVFTPENLTYAESVALCGLSASLQSSVAFWTPTEDVRQAAIQFVLTALSVPASAGLYVESFAKGRALNRYVAPSALKKLLATLRISQPVCG